MTRKKRDARKLAVDKTTLRTLDRKDLGRAAGGAKAGNLDDTGTSRTRGTVVIVN